MNTEISSKNYNLYLQNKQKIGNLYLYYTTKKRETRDNMYNKKIFELPVQLVHELTVRKLKIASAESLTGGMISELITSVAGSSSVFECGICSYSNRIKHEILGVSEKTLEEYTEYSLMTAEEMAEGVRRLSGADIAVSTTGIAGPGGYSEEKPVGLVYVGISAENYRRSYEFRFSEGLENERELIRQKAACAALSIALKYIKKHLEPNTH